MPTEPESIDEDLPPFEPAAAPGYDLTEEMVGVVMESALRQFERADSLVKRLATIVLQGHRDDLGDELVRDLVEYMSNSYKLNDQTSELRSLTGEEGQ